MAIVTRLERYRRLQGLTYKQLGEALDVTTSAAMRYCRRPGHKEHRWPQSEPAARIKEFTSGAVHAGNYADELDLATGDAAFAICAGCDTATACRDRGLCAWANLSTENTQPAKKDAA